MKTPIKTKRLKRETTKVTPESGTWLKVLNFLTEHDKSRYSRIDAYCYLINSVAYDKSFTTSISQLADIWHWQRVTVRKFLTELEQMHQIRREADGKHIKLHILCLDSVTAPTQKWSDTEFMMAVNLVTESIKTNRKPSDIDTENEFSPSELQYLDNMTERIVSHLLPHHST